MGARGWYWRGNVAVYDFVIGNDRFRGSLGIRKDSGLVDGKTPAARADEEVRLMRVQKEQRQTVEQVWEQTKQRMIASQQVALSLDAIWDAWCARSMSTAGMRRKKLYLSHIRDFVDYMNANHPDVKYVSAVTDQHARSYLIQLRGMPGATATKNDKFGTLRRLFATLGRDCGIIENPFAAKDIKRIPPRQINRQIYTPDQIHILFSAEGWMYQLFVTAFSTFQREEDCCLIKKSYIHLDRNRVIFPMTHKTGVEISLPLMPRFRALAETALIDYPETEFLFPELAEKYMSDSGSIGKAVKVFLEKNGIAGATLDVQGYARRVSVLDVHSIRHTAAVMAVIAGWPLPMVMKATGHKSLKMVMRYLDHISDEDKDRYFAQLGKAMPGTAQVTGARKRLADLAYSLPLPEVERLLALLPSPETVSPQPAALPQAL